MRQPKRLKNLDKNEYKRILERSTSKVEEALSAVIPIIKEVKENGDEALVKFTARFDKVNLTAQDLIVSKERIEAAYKKTSPDVVASLKRMRDQVCHFHQHQIRKEWSINKFADKGEGRYELGERFIPIEQVGVYVPGGKANYPSTAIMAVVPAKIAGVSQIILASPPRKTGQMADVVMVAADIAGAHLLINIGGAQAVAALAYGTSTLPKVDMIVGPGNAYVNAAKAYLSGLGEVAIDSPAGPSEILILADDSANPSYIARDMLSQAEHAEDNSAVLVTTSKKLADKVYQYLESEVDKCLRKKIIKKSLEDYGAILIADSLSEAIEFTNEFAPEHLEIMTERPHQVLKEIKNAGSVFLGDFSPVAAGDYLTGTNHILPTGGSARRFSGLSVETFLKKITYQSLSKKALNLMSEDITRLASLEGPYNEHIRSVKARKEGFREAL